MKIINKNKIKSKKDVIFRVLKVVVVALVLVASVIIVKDEILWQFGVEGSTEDVDYEENEENNCNTVGVTVYGGLVTYISPENFDEEGNVLVDQTSSDDIAFLISQADKDESIKAIILEVDSYGGSALAGEEISKALKLAKKPTVALIRDYGVSAGYWAATGADRIFASENSDVGSIGATMSYLDNVKQNQKEGFTYNQLSSGKFKDTGDPNKPLTDEEVNLLMRDVKIMQQNFIKAVAINRNLDVSKVEGLSDGSSMLGKMALENGLIDQVGGMEEVKNYLKEKIGEEIEICW